MDPQKAILHVQIVRFAHDGQPPAVACEFIDADGKCHTIVDKVWMFFDEILDSTSEYPQVGEVRCTVLDQWRDEQGRDLVRIDTEVPDNIWSIEELSEFVVLLNEVSTGLS